MVTKKHKKISSTEGKRHQAVDALGGYYYQILHTIYAWMDLRDNQILYVECLEDFDIDDQGKIVLAQVKHKSRIITLRTSDVIYSINHFWEIKSSITNETVLFRFITTSQIGVEQGNPFGLDIKGLRLWEECKRQTEKIDALRNFLLQNDNLSNELREFMTTSDVKEIQEQLIMPITWETGSQDIAFVKQAIKRKLVSHGEGRGVEAIEASSVVNRLISEVISVACSKGERSLDRARFLEIFEEETTIRVPKNKRYESMTQARPLVYSQLGIFSEATPILFTPTHPVQTSLPPLPQKIASRTQIVEVLQNRLKKAGILVITGSNGMGKTTLAKLIALKDGGDWIWVNFTGCKSDEVRFLIQAIGTRIDSNNNSINIILDDLDLSPGHVQQFEDSIGGLIYTIQNRNRHVIITSKQQMSNRLVLRLGIEQSCLHRATVFGQEEIIQLGMQLSCPEEICTKEWAMIIWAKTDGHPQLVHARVLRLADAGWPVVVAEDVIVQPEEITHQRDDARKLLQELKSDQQELIYRLSLYIGLFRRDQAIAIGEIEPQIRYAGDAFDYLVGPWIEPAGNGYYKISPLLKNAISQVWSSARIVALHRSMADAIMECGKLTSNEILPSLMHSLAGRNEKVIISVAASLVQVPKERWKYLYPYLVWLPGVDFSKEKFDSGTNFILRMLEFKTAVEFDPEKATEIADVWENEITPQDPERTFVWQKYTYSATILINYDITFTPKRLLKLLLEFSELGNRIEKLMPQFSKLELSRLSSDIEGFSDPTIGMFSLILHRCKSIKFLDELLNELQGLDRAFRSRLLKIFQNFDFLGTHIIDAVWMNEEGDKNPDWERCISVFEKTIHYGFDWEVNPLVEAAARGISIICDEYLHEPTLAIVEIDEAINKLGGTSLLLQYAKGVVFFDQKKYDKALPILESIIPQWLSSEGQFNPWLIWAYRIAGISAAHLGDWKKAADLFLGGGKQAKELKLPVSYIGFLADAGFAFWKAGENNRSLECFTDCMIEMDKLVNAEDLGVFTIRKYVGHTLGYISEYLAGRMIPSLVEPNPGMCSNPERKENIKELSSTPLDFSWLNLAKIEYQFGLGKSIYDLIIERLRASNYPAVRVIALDLEIRYMFRDRDFKALPKLCMKLGLATQNAKRHEKQGKEVWEEDANSETETLLSRDALLGTSIFVAAVIALISSNKPIREEIQKWKEFAITISTHSTIIDMINDIDDAFSPNISEALEKVMKPGNISEEKHVLIGTRVCIEEDVSPVHLFCAHVIIFNWLMQILTFNKEIENHLAEMVTKQWLRKTRFRAALKTPNLTIPDIEAACNSNVTGMKKVAQVLLTANDAVSVRLPQNIRENLKIFYWLNNNKQSINTFITECAK